MNSEEHRAAELVVDAPIRASASADSSTVVAQSENQSSQKPEKKKLLQKAGGALTLGALTTGKAVKKLQRDARREGATANDLPDEEVLDLEAGEGGGKKDAKWRYKAGARQCHCRCHSRIIAFVNFVVQLIASLSYAWIGIWCFVIANPGGVPSPPNKTGGIKSDEGGAGVPWVLFLLAEFIVSMVLATMYFFPRICRESMADEFDAKMKKLEREQRYLPEINVGGGCADCCNWCRDQLYFLVSDQGFFSLPL